MSQTPTIGRIVHYKLSAQDAEAINRRREDAVRFNRWEEGKVTPITGDQRHVGNHVAEGDVFPLLITRVWDGGFVNGQVLLDGNDSYWATSVAEGDGVRQYVWPQR